MSSIEESILPFKVKELIEIIMKKKNLSFFDSYLYLISSDLYKRLDSNDAKLWYLSQLALYEILEEEKKLVKKENAPNSKELLFLTFCVENFKSASGKTSEEIMSLFKKFDVFSFLKNNFEQLHTQSKEYIISTIEKFLKTAKKEMQ